MCCIYCVFIMFFNTGELNANEVQKNDTIHKQSYSEATNEPLLAIKIEPITEDEFFKLEKEQERRRLLNLKPLDLSDNAGIRIWLDQHHNLEDSPLWNTKEEDQFCKGNSLDF